MFPTGGGRDTMVTTGAMLLAVAGGAGCDLRASTNVPDAPSLLEVPAAAASPPDAPDAPEAAAPPPAPSRVRRDSVPVPIVAPAVGEDSVMHESAPLVVPDAEARPVTVLFHGSCADDNWTCDWLQYFAMAPQWQLCPRAPVACAGGGYQWTASAPTTRHLLEGAVATAMAGHPGRVDGSATVLAGFSQGAYAVAVLVHELAHHADSPLHVGGVLVQGAGVRFAPEDLRRLGARVALTSGALDAAAPAMKAEGERLARAGIDARYVSLGKDEGHYISVSTGKTVASLLDWCRGPSTGDPP
jgi:predicted esterase